MRFGYARVSEKSGKAKGFVKIDDLIRETEFPESVIHTPLKNYLYLSVGGVGKFFPQFNGQIS